MTGGCTELNFDRVGACAGCHNWWRTCRGAGEGCRVLTPVALALAQLARGVWDGIFGRVPLVSVLPGCLDPAAALPKKPREAFPDARWAYR